MNLKTYESIIQNLKLPMQTSLLAKRRKTIKKIARLTQKAPGKTPRLNRRKQSWFTSSQTSLASRRVNVEVMGKCVGYLTLENSKWLFRKPRSNQAMAWSGDRLAAVKTQNIIGQAWESSTSSNERQIQWSLASSIQIDNTFRKLAVVKLGGHYTELGVSLGRNEEAKSKSGNMDLLVRYKSGSTQEYWVFELKKPNVTKKEDIIKAFWQVLRYAVALRVEAHGFSQSEARQSIWLKDYHQAFGSKSSRPFNVGAVVVLHHSPEVEKLASSILREFADMDSYTTGGITSLKVLFYEYDERTKQPHGWRWLE
jgi:hypothetical protein